MKQQVMNVRVTAWSDNTLIEITALVVLVTVVEQTHYAEEAKNLKRSSVAQRGDNTAISSMGRQKQTKCKTSPAPEAEHQ